MSLRLYNRKRKFDQTPEPKGLRKGKAKGPLQFVVQMHAATRLHFDLRLEFDGVFKSWAVPKGPSLNPLDQRLAVFVEDHPLEYGSFEGIIPKGNYGAGTVMVWDTGTYEERGSDSRQTSNTAMKKNFAKGHLTFVLHGKKLKGEFALIKLKKDEQQKAWLLVKKRDQYATYKRSEIPPNLSVKTGRTMEQIAKQAEAEGDVWLPKKGKAKKKTAVGKTKISREPKHVIAAKAATRVTTPAKKSRVLIPRKIKPMIAVAARTSPPKGWLTEPYPAGLRALAEVEGNRVSLYSKAGLSYNSKFPRVIDALKALHITAVLDGEIVDDDYVIFDLLFYERDLRDEPLEQRRKQLHTLLSGVKKTLKLPEQWKGRAQFQIAKNPQSTYHSGTSKDWLLFESTLKTKKTEKKEQASRAASSDEPRLTHLDKIFFPADAFTKGDVIEYYRSVCPYILPYLKDRPESMNRQPNGIAKPGFFQKDLTGHIPRWLQTQRIYSESAEKSIDYLLCQDERSLLYMANLGCIELNPWFSRVQDLERPDFLVIDLDPDDNSFEEVMNIAREVHDVLDQVGATNCCKTSGATGIHVGVPLHAEYTFDEARTFAELVCKVVERKHPRLTSTVRTPARRKKKIYLDFLQNRRGQTLAAPFCIRPRPGAPVSMPLEWTELKRGLKPGRFHIGNALKRISKFKDPWKAVLGPAVDLKKCMRTLTTKFPHD